MHPQEAGLPARLIAALAAAALLVAPAAAAGDSKITTGGGDLTFVNEDAGVSNTLLVEYDDRGRIRFYDEADPFGMSYPTPPCVPGRLNGNRNAVEVFCERDAVSAITILTGPGEDTVAYRLNDKPVSLSGEVGADTLTTAGAADSVHGGQGNDTIETGAGDDRATGDDGDDTLRTGDGNDKAVGGPGVDTVDTGAGDDSVQVADGTADTVDCGAGNDSVVADTADQVTGCESVSRQSVAAPAAQAPSTDKTAPAVNAGGSTRQRISLARRRIAVAVSATEKSLVAVSGYADAGGINNRVDPASGGIDVGGGGIWIGVTLSKTAARRALDDVRRGRHPSVRFTISAVDQAGNTSAPRYLTIRLAALAPASAAARCADPPCDTNLNADYDGDGYRNDQDNCQETWNPEQVDTDRDAGPPPYAPYAARPRDPAVGGDACDIDDDADTVKDPDDVCPKVADKDQRDSDGDGKGDACDPPDAPAAAAGPPPAPAPAGDARALVLSVTSLRAQQRLDEIRAGITIPVACSKRCTIQSTLVPRGRSAALGRGFAGLEAQGSTFVFLRLSNAALARVARAGSVTCTARLTATDEAGRRVVVTRRLVLRR